MIKKIKLFSLLVCLGLGATITPLNVDAGQAGLMLFPTRFVLSPTEKTVTVNIVNKGDARGSYRIELIDMIMPEDAAIRELEDGQIDPYSLKKFARISPRRTELRPDGVQKVRINIRRPKGLPAGEYRSHVKVTLTEDDLDSVERARAKENVSIQIKSRLAFTIPVIIRQGETSYRVGIDDAELYYADEKKLASPMLNLLFSHEGTRSSMGDVKVYHVDSAGNRNVVNFHPGVAIYRTTDRRRIRVPLTLVDGVDLSSGKLHITYVEKANEGGKLIAEKMLNL